MCLTRQGGRHITIVFFFRVKNNLLQNFSLGLGDSDLNVDRRRRNLRSRPTTLLLHVLNHLSHRLLHRLPQLETSNPSRSLKLSDFNLPRNSGSLPRHTRRLLFSHTLLLLSQHRSSKHGPRFQRRILPHRSPPLHRLLPKRRPLHRPPPGHLVRLPHLQIPRLPRRLRHLRPPDPRRSHQRLPERVDARRSEEERSGVSVSRKSVRALVPSVLRLLQRRKRCVGTLVLREYGCFLRQRRSQRRDSYLVVDFLGRRRWNCDYC